MSEHQPQAKHVFGSLSAFVGLSVVAALVITSSTVPALAATQLAGGTNIFSGAPDYLAIAPLAQPTTIYASKDGAEVELATFYAQNRIPVQLDAIAKVAQDATLAAEDPNFYQHGGIDLQGTIRGILTTVIGKITGSESIAGGSSITQQYVKNVRLQKCEAMPVSNAKDKAHYRDCVDEATGTTPERKFQEIQYSIALEKKLTKQQILTGYLNIAGFGGTVYGIEAAAQYYFNTTAAKLSAAQAASLIAIVNHPSALKLDMPDSTTNGAANGYAANKERRDYILANMYEEKRLTKAQYDQALATPVQPVITPSVRGCQKALGSAYFCDYVRHVVLADPAFGKTTDDRVANFNRGGYKIYTTLDMDLQQVAEDTLNSWMPKDYSATVGGALVGVEPGTGRILYMAQNKDYTQDPDVVASDPVRYTGINFNTDSDYGGSNGFQPGSVYKVFTLAEWLKQGHSLSETVDARTQTYTSGSNWPFKNSCSSSGSGTWTPKNDDFANLGSMSVTAATQGSVNTAFVGMAKQLDLCNIKKDAEAFGVHSAKSGVELGSTAASILGTNEVAPLTMATAFAGIANKGTVCTPIAIDSIVDASGKKITPPQSSCSSAVTPQVAAAMDYALKQVVTGGTARGINQTSVDMLAKTGTTDDALHVWLVAATTKVASAYWAGNISGKTSMRSIKPAHGLTVASARTQVQKAMMTAAAKKYGGDPFPTVERTLLRGTTITVPDLVGKTPNQAVTILSGLGFTVATGQDEDSAVDAGTVSSTNPAAGTEASKGASITVNISNGSLTRVPAVTGQTVSAAQAALTQAGLGMELTTGPGQSDWVVTSIEPGAGTTVKRGTGVRVNAKAP